MTTDRIKQAERNPEIEYQEILELWQIQTKSSSLNLLAFEQQEILDLLCGFLNQVWSDAQQMSQGSWKYQEPASCNTIGLHWMRQALETRQKAIDIMSSKKNSLNDSAATILPDSSYVSFSHESISTFASESFLPIKLRSSPSTPTLSNFGSRSDELPICMNSTQGESSCLATMSHKNLSCYHCHEKVGMKRSFSANDVCALDHTSNSSYHSANSIREDEEVEGSIDETNTLNQSIGRSYTKHNSYTHTARQSFSNHDTACYCSYYYQSDIDGSSDVTENDDASISGSKLLLKKENTALDECYKEKLVKYMLLEKVNDDSKDNQDNLSLHPSLNSSCNNLGLSADDNAYQQKKDREELRRYICYEHNDSEMQHNTNPTLLVENHLDIQAQDPSQTKKKESKFIQILKSSSSQLSLFNMKKKDTRLKQKSFFISF
ncbi:hypothetical protein BD560DRAFT_486364 [Blakeslea trispora]|nr:hypothetical protein BD560DRAFT_486364 [Blakeslea trispora]